MTPDQAFTLTVSAVGIGGALAGIVIGHFLTRAWQQKQYRMDNIKTESRELLTALMTIYPAYTMWARERFRLSRLPFQGLAERDDEYLKVTVDFHKFLNDRLFIATAIRRLKVREKWDFACLEFETGFDERN